MRLGTLLLRDGMVSLGQLEAALHSQVLYGGRLGTHLVTLGFLEVSVLERYLSEALGAPVASRALFDAADPEIMTMLDRELAERCEAVPLCRRAGNGDEEDAVVVAFANPRDARRVAEIARALVRPVVPYVAAEMCIQEYLERYYGVSSRPRRAVAAPEKASGSPGSSGSPSSPVDRPPAASIEASAQEREDGLDDVEQLEATDPQAVPHGALMTHGDAVDKLARAGSRDQVADVLMGFARGRFEAAAVLAIRRGEAVPWRLQNASGPISIHAMHTAAGVANPVNGLSLTEPSVLQAAYERGTLHRGRPICMPQRVERALWQTLEVDREPRDMLVVPVLVKQHVVNLIYAHGAGGEIIDDGAAGQLADLAGHMAQAYARLIRQSRALGGQSGGEV